MKIKRGYERNFGQKWSKRIWVGYIARGKIFKRQKCASIWDDESCNTKDERGYKERRGKRKKNMC